MDDAWEKLRKLIRETALVRLDTGNPVLGPDGTNKRWTFDSWSFSMSAVGATLSTQCILQLLKTFKATQLATLGLSGVPFVTGCILSGDGKYSGLCIRNKTEIHGKRQIEGQGDKSLPVVLIDDCLNTGSTIVRAIATLEKAGYIVEGCVFLVQYSGKGAAELLRGSGYKAEAVFDIWRDLNAPGFYQAITDNLNRLPWNNNIQLPNGISPVAAARLAIKQFFLDGSIPIPPVYFDDVYDARGGVEVSVRKRSTSEKIARNGFIALNSYIDFGVAISYGAFIVARDEVRSLSNRDLDDFAIAVSVHGSQSVIKHSEINFLEFAITIQSDRQPGKVATILPQDRSVSNEVKQLYAAKNKAKIAQLESYTLFRHQIRRITELGDDFWNRSSNYDHSGVLEDVGRKSTMFVNALVRNLANDECSVSSSDLDRLNIPEAWGVAVTLYSEGTRGCWCCFQGMFIEKLTRAAKLAFADKRFRSDGNIVKNADIYVVVSILERADFFSRASVATVSTRIATGLHSIVAQEAGKIGVILSHVPCYYDWSQTKMCEHTKSKACLESECCFWTSYKTTSWLSRQNSVEKLEFGYPIRETFCTLENIRNNLISNLRYMQNHTSGDDLPGYFYQPSTDAHVTSGRLSRRLLGCLAMVDLAREFGDQSLQNAETDRLARFVKEFQSSERNRVISRHGAGSKCILLLAVAKQSMDVAVFRHCCESLYEEISLWLLDDGAISPLHRRRIESDQDILPGAVLCALYEASNALGRTLPSTLDLHLKWYEKRFGLVRSWGMTWWHIPVWSKIFRQTGNLKYAEFCFEMADWVIDHQIERTGAFLVDYQPESPGFHTACVLEGLAEAINVASFIGDKVRLVAYVRAWEKGFMFLDKLIFKQEDTFHLPSPEMALGGVRGSPVSTGIRIDYVAHTALALLGGSVALTGARKLLGR